MAYLDSRPADQPETPSVAPDSPAEHPTTPAEDVASETPSTPESAAPSTPADSDSEPQLITDEQAEALKDDPIALRKSLQKAFTQKTQQLAAERKEMATYKDLIDAYKADPKATIEALARNAGLEVKSPEETAKPAEDPVEVVRAALAESLGPEYEDLAERLAPALAKAVKAEAERATAPLRSMQEQQLQEAALNEANAEMEHFGKQHPDWKEYEAEMNELGAMLTPKPGMKPQQFLKMLYMTVKGDKAIAEATSKALTKMQRSAEGGAKTTGSVAADKVAMTPTKPLTFTEAAALAKRGIRVE
jgi:hypothetical protein